MSEQVVEVRREDAEVFVDAEAVVVVDHHTAALEERIRYSGTSVAEVVVVVVEAVPAAENAVAVVGESTRTSLIGVEAAVAAGALHSQSVQEKGMVDAWAADILSAFEFEVEVGWECNWVGLEVEIEAARMDGQCRRAVVVVLGGEQGEQTEAEVQ